MEQNMNEKIVPGILCDATHCIYHTMSNKCSAGAIEVGYKSACNSSETACTTFKPKD